ncbi:MAG: lipopolysaccharide biosynthesis protein [Clostridium sp.]|jgi:O-antigen/teichoic acid export membrane protein|uniref:lipopolysaccharide biosynthesis protein n=1 Tax=Clostridium sp. TaxID=1506 RepID=UPI0025C4F3BB|nr:lipopolysaccharide biosynthesis protein [Clostridium sp.]MCH3963471.1 lipopolysaccharide biosynthesis protein [Clostridium sp.]MCI1714612.1 lipopolysaccharide biosynthesis protein [Clostridium sp.]MCI1799199.1 lipopolysaccharide biosynthesis protein [Clostridium sp.]MCI1812795.1 lipopolysaccharide biosynthesis protein [Clostridium sp.]MCI1869685.1 lipopolysaccharide biosynthesis protein [Clostridium sp.]
MISRKEKIDIIIFPILDISLNGANYFFHIFISWYLLPKDYGMLNSILSVLTILLVVGISFQTYVAKYVSKNGMEEFRIFYIIKCAILFFVFFASIVLIFIPNLIEAIQYNGTMLLLIFIFGINILLSIFRGIFQGRKSFFLLNISFYIEMGFKIAAIATLFVYCPTINTILVSILIGMIIALIHGIYMNRQYLIFNKNVFTGGISKNIIGQLSNIYTANFFFNFFTSVDMIIVNYYLPQSSGVYAIVLKYNQLLTFASNSIYTVFLPLLSERSRNKKGFKKCIFILFVVMLAVSFLALIVYKFIMPATIEIFFTHEYSSAKNYLFLGIISYILLNFVFMIININIVIDRSFYLIILFISSIAFIFGIAAFHKDIYMILYVEIVFYGILLLFVAVDMLRNLFAKKEFYLND